jgi:hypothetical protein
VELTVSSLDEALDDVAAEDLQPVSGPALLDRLRCLLEAQNRIAAEVARTVRECELSGAAEHDGLRSMASWLRGHGRLSPAAAQKAVRAGRVLERLPAVAAACAAGDVPADQLGLLAPVAEEGNLAAAAAQGVAVAEVDRLMADTAATLRYADLAKVVQRYLDRLDPDGPEPDPTEGRRLAIAEHADGSISGRFHLDAVGGEKLQAALESIAQAGRAAGDTRSRGQQLADALVQLCDNALASGGLPVLRSVKPHVIVRVDLEDLTDPATGPGVADTGSGAILSAARARWLACDASISRIVLDPDGLPLDVGRTQRIVPPHLRRAVEHRDRGCVFAGCGAPTHWCDVHHVLEWVHGGATSLDNSALLCERHHTKVHHGFRVERRPDGTWRTRRPDGTEIHIGRQSAAA